jgi:SnoaL-like domain
VDYKRYIQAFNTGEDAQLVQEWFTQDCIFQSGPRLMHGREKLLEFLRWAHDGIREIIRAQTVLQDESHLFAEIDMDFHATRDRPDFLFGPLKRGEFLTVKFFVLYRLREGKVAHLKASTWPPNVGVTKPTSRLGGSHEQRQAYMEYARAFSNADFDRFSAYYTDDVVCELTAGIVLRGKDGIVDFYREMFKTVRESLTLHQLIADDAGLAADITSQFTAIEDAPGFVVTPLKKGEFVRVPVFVHYTLRDGKISHIKVGRAGEVSKPQRA